MIGRRSPVRAAADGGGRGLSLLRLELVQGDRVRVSVLCRPPVDAWVATWQASGLRGAMLKAANGRYIPGDRTPEWREVTKVAARR